MNFIRSFIRKDPPLILIISFLMIISYMVLRSIAPAVFPTYFFYFGVSILVLFIFSHLNFEILSLFKWQIYVFCLVFLLIPLIIGQVTRGAVRWIPIGSVTLQPSEIVRPFVLLFFANYLTEKEVTFKRFIKSIAFLLPILVLILAQPSLGVTILTAVGYFGVLLASSFSKKTILVLIMLSVLVFPLSWLVLAPYQKQRVMTFLSPSADPAGAGYNSLQSMISVGSGRIWGRGLGQGVQTQLSFLPERHTDFIFASVAEEMGFIGAFVLLLASTSLLFRLNQGITKTSLLAGRCFISGLFLTLFFQTLVHIGMNMGMLPITGVPLPLVSAGGSSLISTMIGLGITISAYDRKEHRFHL